MFRNPHQWMSKGTAAALANFALVHDPDVEDVRIQEIWLKDSGTYRNIVRLRTKNGSVWALNTPGAYNYYRNDSRPTPDDEQALIEEMCQRLTSRPPSTNGFKAHKRLS